MKQHDQSFAERVNTKMRKSISVRIITITVLILLLLIPVTMIQSLIRERQYRQQEAFEEVSSSWAHQQTITGPVLTIPYKSVKKVQNANNNGYQLVEIVSYAHFFPKELTIHGNVDPKERYRGIYKVIVYNAQLQISGEFDVPDFKELDIPLSDVLWERAYVSIGISDVRGIQDNISMQWNSDTLLFDPGLENTDIFEHGVSSNLVLPHAHMQGSAWKYSVAINCNGSSRLSFVPLGKTTEVFMNAKWGSPKFDGSFLPDERVITNDSVYAHWKVLHLNRPYPQQVTASMYSIEESQFGITLKVPVDEYQKSMRSAKYAALFITLTFLIFFFIQILRKVQIHPIQYIIVGLALCVFYTLLIALSEHIPFAWSYLIASCGVIGLIGMYAYFMFANLRITKLFVLLLTLLYGFIFTIIQLEDYALLMGSVGLFVVLAVVMVLSRKIDWYNAE